MALSYSIRTGDIVDLPSYSKKTPANREILQKIFSRGTGFRSFRRSPYAAPNLEGHKHEYSSAQIQTSSCDFRLG